MNTIQIHPITIPSLERANFPSWVAAIRLRAGVLNLSTAIEDPNFTADPIFVRTLASLTNAIIKSITSEAQSESIHGNPDLKIQPQLRHIDRKYNRTSAVDHDALALRALQTLLLQYDTLDE